MSRSEFLEIIKETACLAAELIEEGCGEIPTPLKMLTITAINTERLVYHESNSESTESIEPPTFDSYINFNTDIENIHVYKLPKEICTCTGMLINIIILNSTNTYLFW